MPQFQVTTKQAEQVWASPDGQKVIFKLTLDYNGQEMQAKTYSKAIATQGWSGTVDTYEKQGRNGSETFVKQPPKEGFTPGAYGSQGSTGGGARPQYGGGKPLADPFTMYLSYAKDITVAMVNNGQEKPDYQDLIDQTIVGAYALYESRPDAPAKPSDSKELVYETTATDDDLLKNIDEVFGPKEKEEKPWTEPPQLPVN